MSSVKLDSITVQKENVQILNRKFLKKCKENIFY